MNQSLSPLSGNFRGEPDMLAVTGDKSGGASDVLKLGAQAHLRLS